MVVQPIRFNNRTRESKKHLLDLFSGRLGDIYDEYTNLVGMHLDNTLILPCCGKTCPPGKYAMNGTYTRRRPIVDVYRDERGMFHIEIYENFEIQLIECEDHNGHTRCHALLFDLFTPYDSFTLRAKVYFFQLFLESNQSIEVFCEKHRLSLPVFKRWRAWIRSHFSQLLGIGNKYAGTRKHLLRNALYRFYDYFDMDYLSAYRRSVDLFHATVFQTRATPAQSKKLCGLPIF